MYGTIRLHNRGCIRRAKRREESEGFRFDTSTRKWVDRTPAWVVERVQCQIRDEYSHLACIKYFGGANVSANSYTRYPQASAYSPLFRSRPTNHVSLLSSTFAPTFSLFLSLSRTRSLALSTRLIQRQTRIELAGMRIFMRSFMPTRSLKIILGIEDRA